LQQIFDLFFAFISGYDSVKYCNPLTFKYRYLLLNFYANVQFSYFLQCSGYIMTHPTAIKLTR